MFTARIAGIAILALAITGCMMAEYTKPTHSASNEQYSINLKKDFDTVWKELVQYSASTFFAIDNYEKDSGLITLSFGAAKPSEFITGGHWKATSTTVRFEGDYVDYLSSQQNADLQGRMNIVVTELSDNETAVKVNARYVFTTPSQRTDYSVIPGTTWSFDTGNCDTAAVSNPAQGTGSMRTICPTYKAENSIIEAIR